MAGPYSSIADVSGLFGAPETTQVPEGAGYATGAGKGIIEFDQFLKGIRAGHAALAMQKYGQAENQVRVSKDTYEAVTRQLEAEKATASPERLAQLQAAQKKAFDEYTAGSDELINFFNQKGQKGKGGPEGQKVNMGEKIGEFLKRFITGGSGNTTQPLSPVGRPTFSNPAQAPATGVMPAGAGQ